MRCTLVCLLASVVAIGSFACMMPVNTNAIAELRELLDERQLEILNGIVEERSRIAFEGLVLGLIITLPVVLVFRAWCSATLILFLTQSAYYHVTPKTEWMLNHLETREQVDQWLVVYKKMQRSGIMTSLSACLLYLTISIIFKD